MEYTSRFIAVKSSSFETKIQSTDLSTFKDVIEDPIEWLRTKVKGQEGQALRAWIEDYVDHKQEIYLGVSFTNKTLKYCRIHYEWVEREDEAYGSCLAGDGISWVTEEQYRGEGLTPNDTIIVVKLSPIREITVLCGAMIVADTKRWHESADFGVFWKKVGRKASLGMSRQFYLPWYVPPSVPAQYTCLQGHNKPQVYPTVSQIKLSKNSTTPDPPSTVISAETGQKTTLRRCALSVV
ncbi:hypothetical protein V493_00315 [Pseudogymnoascus sp. VKM F-4281 (FW-2241)]|nr:hypothetical protein V493_00315 [Pseudogymnoascus sp. VKM F-4281 (FW-2241)]